MADTYALSTANLSAIVEAESPDEAFNELKDQPVEHFGLVVHALRLLPGEAPEVTEDSDPERVFTIRTTALFGRWGRIGDARLADAKAVEIGLPSVAGVDFDG